jgi:putative PEP-CTERM system histidine kinase
MDFTLSVFLVSAAYCCGVGLLAVWRDRRSVAHLAFAAGMLLLAAEAVFNGLSTHAAIPEQIARWQWYRLACMGFVPAPWLVFSLAYGRGNYREFLRRWRMLIVAAFLAPFAAVLGGGDALIVRTQVDAETGGWFLRLGQPGILLNVSFLLTAVLVLMNLERTFRSSLGTMRWRIKYMILGLAALFVFRMYAVSQAILYSSVVMSLQKPHGFELLLSCGLITVALARSTIFNADVYPSHAVLYRSLTIVLVGIYLLVVGVLSQVVNVGLPLKAFLVLVALVGLSVLLLSERIRGHARRFVSRHFRRPLYDYRQVWAAFTEQTTSLVDETELCRKAAQWMSETFQFLSVTIWLTNGNKDRLVYAASTSIPQESVDVLPGANDNEADLIQALAAMSEPTEIETCQQPWAGRLRQRNPDYFPDKGGHRACVPLKSRGEFLGVAIVGDRVSGLSYSAEDFELLKCIGDQLAARLMNIDLSKRLLQAKQMEAFQTMSAFFVHDLKNTTFTLSLLLQNLQEHFEDPGFRADALRAVSKSVERMNHLIERLSFLRHELKIKSEMLDLNKVVEAAIANAGGLPQMRLTQDLNPLPKAEIDAEQIQKVIINLLLNAADATGEGGDISVKTTARDGWVVLAVTDNGCGMSSEFMQKSLFRPFQTTKKKGIGIGMFHSKMIVDAHRGRVEVESQMGKGTTIRVLLPVQGQTP